MSMYSESLRAFLRPVLPFLDDPEVTEIMVNGPTEIWVERAGKVFRTDAAFTEEGLLAAARNMGQFVGRVLSDERPRLDARLPDGSRIHVVLPPVARRGTTIAIRKFAKDKLSMARLVEIGAATQAMSRFIDAVVRMKLNVVVAGGTGSGKTTLLNVLSRFIPDDERILTIEDSAELQLQQPHIVAFESRPPDKFGKGEVTLGDLLNSALRLRPDRIVVGEVRGGECFYLLQAMNTGHGGSLATTHANTPVDTLRRLESLCLLSGVELPVVAIRAQVASAVGLVVVCERFSDGTRKITHISEVLPLNERGDYRTQDLFVYTPTGKDPQTGRVRGYHAPTGVLPSFLRRLRAYGNEDIEESFFDPATYKVPPPPVFTADVAVQTRWAPSLRNREQGLPDAAPPPDAPDNTTFDGPIASASANAKPPPDALEAPPEPTAETPRDSIPTPFAPEPVAAVVAPPEPEPARPDVAPAKPAERAKPTRLDEPSIQISEDLLEDVQRAIGNDRTHVKKNPLLDAPAPARTPTPAPAPRPAAGEKRRRVEEDETDPHIRMPPK
jgi:pilus assembly protein CpaF